MTAVSKVTLNGTTLIDATVATATASEIIYPYTAMTADGVITTGAVTTSGWTTDGIAINTEPNGLIIPTGTTIGNYAFAYKPITTVNLTNVTTIGSYAFYYCTSLLTVLNTNNITTLGDGAFQNSGLTDAIFENMTQVATHLFQDSNVRRVVAMGTGNYNANYWVQNCSNLEILACPNCNSMSVNGWGFQNDTSLKIVDYGNNGSSYYSSLPSTAPLHTLIYRKSNAIVTLSSGDATTLQALPAFTNGTGFKVYIPKVLYDHLGDGTALDYQNATNWATLYATGYLTFEKIEGSVYEDKYWWRTA